MTIDQIYIDDNVFGSTYMKLLDGFVASMSSTIEMTMVSELTFFLGLQINQLPNGIFISQYNYAKKSRENVQSGK